MRLIEPVYAVAMAPLGLALGVAGVWALEAAFLGAWLAGGVLIVGLILLDARSEAVGHAPWGVLLDWLHIRSRRMRRMARNLFCGGFVVGVLTSVMFATNAFL